MEHAIEQATDQIVAAIAREMALAGPQSYPSIVAILGRYTGALQAAGLIAPAPLREEWAVQWARRGGEIRTYPCDDEADARDCADDETTVHRYVSDWLPVERAKSDAMNRQNTVVLARDVAAAEAAGYPRHRWCVVTPRNIKIGPRGMQARYAVAVDLTDDELTEMLVHDSVAPTFLWAGEAEVVRVTAEADGRAEQ